MKIQQRPSANQPKDEKEKEKAMSDVSKATQELATDLDKAPSGEQIIERILTAVVLLQRENAELKAQLAEVLDKMQLLTVLVDSDHAALMILNGQRQAVAEGKIH
jgi:hypothetical protein